MLTKYLILFGISVGFTYLIQLAEAASDGKYHSSKYKHYHGKYKSDNSGKYRPKKWPYVHVHDNRELGKYFHIHIPYDGGYGPYDSDIDLYRYEFDPNGAYSQDKYTVSRPDPFNAQLYDIPQPDIYLQYGFPEHSNDKRSIAQLVNQDFLANVVPQVYKKQRERFIASQKVSPSTDRPRTKYDDEGKWKIIRQQEAKNKERYDFLYLTENGIYAEEQASILSGKSKAGTVGQGYYEYTGDDGQIYRVDYTVGEQGFVPSAKHIPTAPPIPEGIRKALEYVQKKHNAKKYPITTTPTSDDIQVTEFQTTTIQPSSSS